MHIESGSGSEDEKSEKGEVGVKISPIKGKISWELEGIQVS